MNKQQLLLYYIIGYLLLLIFWVCAWNIIDSCLEKVTNNKFLRNNKMIFNLFLLVLVACILMKHYDYKFNINK